MSRPMVVILAFLLALQFLLGSAASASALAANDHGELKIGLSAEPETLDPHLATSTAAATVIMNVFDPLIWRDANGKFQPGLAESWDVSADNSEYTFHLRDGVTFHDGAAFDAAAVEFNVERIADPSSSSGLAAFLLGPYSHAVVIDPLTVRIVFDQPNPAFLDSASQPFLSMVSPTATRATDSDLGHQPVGTGFMILDDWVLGDHIALRRNDEYAWGSPAFQSTGPVDFNRMTFRFYLEESLRLAAFQAGEVDVLDQVKPRDITVLNDGRPYQSLNATALGVPISLVLDTETAPTDDLAVRRALNHVLDREQIAGFAFRGASQPAYAPLAPDTPYAADAGAADIPFDPDFAASLLDAAGWEMQDSGIREKDGRQLVLRWAIGPWDAQWAELAQAQFSQLGAVIQITRLDEASLGDGTRDGEINMVSTVVPGSDPIVLEQLFKSTDVASGSTSIDVYNPELDKLLHDGATARSEDKRARSYNRAQALIVDEALTVPIALLPENVVVAANVTGIHRDFRNGLWFHDVTLAAPATEPQPTVGLKLFPLSL